MPSEASMDPVEVLRIRSLKVIYPGRGTQRGHDVVAVGGVDLHVARGEIVGVVGESGSGKSTLGLASVGLGRASSGSIEVVGQRFETLKGRKLRRFRAQVQMVFQDPHGSLDPRQTVGNGLSELRKLHPSRTDWITDEELLDKVGLPVAMLGRLPYQISGGQAQRVAIARALLLRPALLVADEPTSGLDVSVQAQILTLLQRLREDEGLGILFISHDLSVVRQLCDRIYVMRDGFVVEEGETEQVLLNPSHGDTKRLLNAIPGRDILDLGTEGDLPTRQNDSEPT